MRDYDDRGYYEDRPNKYSIWSLIRKRKEKKATRGDPSNDRYARGPVMRNTKRKRAILSAILFFVFLVIYLWIWNSGSSQAYGFLTARTSSNPIVIFFAALRRGTFPLLIFMCIDFFISRMLAFAFIQEKETRFDPRGIELDPTMTAGASHLMTEEEKRTLYKYLDPRKPDGVLFAIDKSTRELMTVPWETEDPDEALSNRNIALFGPPGMRKTSGVLLPNIFSNIQHGNSLVVTDPKGELYSETYAAARYYGYNVRVFNILGTQFENSDGWDALKVIRTAKDKIPAAQMFANVLLSNAQVAAGDNFWWMANLNCLMLALIYVATISSFRPYALRQDVNETGEIFEPGDNPDDPYEKYRTMEEVFALITSENMKEDIELAIAEDPMGEGKILRPSYTIWQKHPQRDSIQSGLGVALSILQTPALAHILSTDDIDFKELIEEKTIIYIICSDQDRTYKCIMTLFLSFLFREVVAVADARPQKTLDRPLYLIMEEAGNIGKIPDMAPKVSTVRSRNIGIMFCFQTLGQMKDIYGAEVGGKYEWETILGGCAMHLCLGGNDETTNEYFSKRSGTMSTVNKRDTEHRNKYLPERAQEIAVLEKKQQTTIGSRPTMFPDEIQHIKKTEILLSPAVGNVTLEDKYYYKNHPLYQIKLIDELTGEEVGMKNTLDHIPRWRQTPGYKERFIPVVRGSVPTPGEYEPQITYREEGGRAKSFSDYLGN